MKIHYFILHQALFTVSVASVQLCPDGSFVLGRGLQPQDEKAALDEHNRFRQMLVDGVVPGQPRAKYMKTMSYDRVLGEKCVPVSDQCAMKHIKVYDERWICVGQNIFIEWHSQFKPAQNWTAALESWFYECNDFQYPDVSINGNDVGHYTQVVWANSDTVGCDVISYLDLKKPSTPFCKMYTCNYGPCGNFNNLPPYVLADADETHEDESDDSWSEDTDSSDSESLSWTTSSHVSHTTEKSGDPFIKILLNNIFGKGAF